MTYKVTVSSGNNYSVKMPQQSIFKAPSSHTIEIIITKKIDKLIKVQINSNNNEYKLI